MRSIKHLNSNRVGLAVGGFAVGIINGLLGAGGGMLAVPLLCRVGRLDRHEAHINSVAIILPLSAFSAILYCLGGRVEPREALVYLPGGMLGVLAGTYIIKKISGNMLRKAFAVFMLWAGIRILMR